MPLTSPHQCGSQGRFIRRAPLRNHERFEKDICKVMSWMKKAQAPLWNIWESNSETIDRERR